MAASLALFSQAITDLMVSSSAFLGQASEDVLLKAAVRQIRSPSHFHHPVPDFAKLHTQWQDSLSAALSLIHI